MPDDEGLALVAAGDEAGRRRPGGTFLEIGAWCGKSEPFTTAESTAY